MSGPARAEDAAAVHTLFTSAKATAFVDETGASWSRDTRAPAKVTRWVSTHDGTKMILGWKQAGELVAFHVQEAAPGVVSHESGKASTLAGALSQARRIADKIREHAAGRLAREPAAQPVALPAPAAPDRFTLGL